MKAFLKNQKSNYQEKSSKNIITTACKNFPFRVTIGCVGPSPWFCNSLFGKSVANKHQGLTLNEKFLFTNDINKKILVSRRILLTICNSKITLGL